MVLGHAQQTLFTTCAPIPGMPLKILQCHSRVAFFERHWQDLEASVTDFNTFLQQFKHFKYLPRKLSVAFCMTSSCLLIALFFLRKYLFYGYECFASMSVCTMCAPGVHTSPEEATGSSGDGVTDYPLADRKFTTTVPFLQPVGYFCI